MAVWPPLLYLIQRTGAAIRPPLSFVLYSVEDRTRTGQRTEGRTGQDRTGQGKGSDKIKLFNIKLSFKGFRTGQGQGKDRARTGQGQGKDRARTGQGQIRNKNNKLKNESRKIRLT